MRTTVTICGTAVEAIRESGQELFDRLEDSLHLLEALELQSLPRYFKAQIDSTNRHSRAALVHWRWTNEPQKS